MAPPRIVPQAKLASATTHTITVVVTTASNRRGCDNRQRVQARAQGGAVRRRGRERCQAGLQVRVLTRHHRRADPAGVLHQRRQQHLRCVHMVWQRGVRL